MALPLQYLHSWHHHKNNTIGVNWCAYNVWWIVGGSFDHTVFNISVAIQGVLAHFDNVVLNLMSWKWRLGFPTYEGRIGGSLVQGTSPVSGFGFFLQDPLPDESHLLIRRYTDDGYLHRVGPIHISGIPKGETTADALSPIYQAFIDFQMAQFTAPYLRYGLTFQAAYWEPHDNVLIPWVRSIAPDRVYSLHRRRGGRIRTYPVVPNIPP